MRPREGVLVEAKALGRVVIHGFGNGETSPIIVYNVYLWPNADDGRSG